MNNERVSCIIRVSVVLLFILGIIMCAFWYPMFVSLSTKNIIPAHITLEEKMWYWSELIFYWLSSVPCFVILIIMWKISIDVIKMNYNPIIKELKLVIIILIIDISVFLIGNASLSILGWDPYYFIYYAFCVIGLIVTSIFYIIYLLVKRIIELKM